MGMVKMKHINIYGPEQDPQQTLEVLAKLACFHPDKDAERINAAAGAAENLYTPLLASTLGLIKDCLLYPSYAPRTAFRSNMCQRVPLFFFQSRKPAIRANPNGSASRPGSSKCTSRPAAT